MKKVSLANSFAKLPSLILALASVCSSPLSAELLGIIGGQDSNTSDPYVAHISTTGVVTPITGLPPPVGLIYSVSMNQSGNSLVGGPHTSTGAPIAAFVSSTGMVTLVTGLPALGGINQVAINDSNNGLIGGRASGASYAAYVSSGVATTLLGLPPAASEIHAVAINSSGNGLIGGESSSAAYAARASSGTATSLSGLPGTGIIYAVAINQAGVGLIGGQNQAGLQPAFGAFVPSSGPIISLTGLPNNAGISSVAINSSGNGLIGGSIFGVPTPYAARVSFSSPAVIPISGLQATGQINSIAINSSGTGLIGGDDGSAPFAAFVSPSGVVTLLGGLPSFSTISSVAINDAGNGIIGGEDFSGTNPAFAALVSSSGSVTVLTGLPSFGVIDSVALLLPALSQIPTLGLSGNNLILANYINTNAPDLAFYFVPSLLDGTLSEALESTSPARHAFDVFTADNNLFSLNNGFTQHAEDTRHYWRFQEKYCSKINKNKKNKAKKEGDCSCELSARPYQIWTKMIGVTSRQKPQHQTPALQPWTSGLILGFDAHSSSRSVYGLGTAYTHTYMHQTEHGGHSRIEQEYLFAYGMWNNEHFYGDVALWGGLFQIHNSRNIEMTGFKFKSTSRPKGWQLAPHAEVGYRSDYKSTCATFEPFAMFNWISNWLGHYKEKGSGPFNFGQKKQYSSFLRSELGLRVYETIEFTNWRLVFQEKGSYVNRKPFHVGNVTAYLVGAPGSFTVETLTAPQNLGVAAAKVLFESNNPCYPYGSIAYQGEFGPTYQSHQLSANLGWNF